MEMGGNVACATPPPPNPIPHFGYRQNIGHVSFICPTILAACMWGGVGAFSISI